MVRTTRPFAITAVGSNRAIQQQRVGYFERDRSATDAGGRFCQSATTAEIDGRKRVTVR
jgi:hypothetical protein